MKGEVEFVSKELANTLAMMAMTLLLGLILASFYWANWEGKEVDRLLAITVTEQDVEDARLESYCFAHGDAQVANGRIVRDVEYAQFMQACLLTIGSGQVEWAPLQEGPFGRNDG